MVLLPVDRKKAIGCAIIGGLTAFCANHSSAADDASGKHFLWRTTNTPAPCYLFGSIHSLRSTDFKRTPAITQAIKDSQQFYFEVDPKQEHAFTTKLIEAAKYPKGVEIKDKIHPKTYGICARLR
jgi:uncharacterized protein YbaP (TraB family)